MESIDGHSKASRSSDISDMGSESSSAQRSTFSSAFKKFSAATFVRHKSSTVDVVSDDSAVIQRSYLPIPNGIPRTTSFFSSFSSRLPTAVSTREPSSRIFSSRIASRPLFTRNESRSAVRSPSEFFNAGKRRESSFQVKQHQLMAPLLPSISHSKTLGLLTNDTPRQPLPKTPSYARPTSSSAAKRRGRVSSGSSGEKSVLNHTVLSTGILSSKSKRIDGQNLYESKTPIAAKRSGSLLPMVALVDQSSDEDEDEEPTLTRRTTSLFPTVASIPVQYRRDSTTPMATILAKPRQPLRILMATNAVGHQPPQKSHSAGFRSASLSYRGRMSSANTPRELDHTFRNASSSEDDCSSMDGLTLGVANKSSISSLKRPRHDDEEPAEAARRRSHEGVIESVTPPVSSEPGENDGYVLDKVCTPDREPWDPSQVEDSMEDRYWLGRVCALSDRFRTEELSNSPPRMTPSPTLSNDCPGSTSSKSQGMHNDERRFRRVFGHLNSLCETNKARASLAAFKIRFEARKHLEDKVEEGKAKLPKKQKNNGRGKPVMGPPKIGKVRDGVIENKLTSFERLMLRKKKPGRISTDQSSDDLEVAGCSPVRAGPSKSGFNNGGFFRIGDRF